MWGEIWIIGMGKLYLDPADTEMRRKGEGDTGLVPTASSVTPQEF